MRTGATTPRDDSLPIDEDATAHEDPRRFGPRRGVATFTTNYGDLVSNWSTEDGGFRYHVEIPTNASATVHVPLVSEGETVLESDILAADAEGVTLVGIEEGVATLEVVSGSYDFAIGAAPEPEPTYEPTHEPEPTVTAPTDEAPTDGAPTDGAPGGDDGDNDGPGSLPSTGADGAMVAILAFLGMMTVGTGASLVARRRSAARKLRLQIVHNATRPAQAG